MGLTLKIGTGTAAVDYTGYVDFRSILLEYSQELKGGTMACTLKIRDGQIAVPLAGQEITLDQSYVSFSQSGVQSIKSDREFGGTIIRRLWKRIEQSTWEITLICQDYTYLLNRRYLNKLYPGGVTDNTADLDDFFPGSLFREVLQDLVDVAVSENPPGGDVHYNAFLANLRIISHGDYGIRSIRAVRVAPTQMFEQITESAGLYWYVSPDKEVILQDYTLLDAPLRRKAATVTTEDGQTISVLLPTLDLTSTELEDNAGVYFDLEEEEDVSNVGTKAVLQNARIRSTATLTDTFNWSTSDPHEIFKLTRRPFSELDIQSVTITTENSLGNEVVTTYDQQLDDVDGTVGQDDPAANHVAIYVGASSNDNSYVRFARTELTQRYNAHHPDGPITITVTYYYAVTDDREGISIDGIAEMARRTGGDGVHEFVYSKVNSLELTSQTQADLVASILLDRKARVHVRGTFNSYIKGWLPGQRFFRVSPVDPDDYFYVVTVTKEVEAPNDVTDPHSRGIRLLTTVEYSNIPQGLNP